MIKSLSLPAILSHSGKPVAPAVNYKAPRRGLRKAQLDMVRLYASYALLVIGGVLAFAYLLGVNSYASQGYEIKQLQTNLGKLQDQYQKLNLSVSEQSAITLLQNDFSGSQSQFVAASDPHYLQVNAVATAMK